MTNNIANCSENANGSMSSAMPNGGCVDDKSLIHDNSDGNDDGNSLPHHYGQYQHYQTYEISGGEVDHVKLPYEPTTTMTMTMTNPAVMMAGINRSFSSSSSSSSSPPPYHNYHHNIPSSSTVAVLPNSLSTSSSSSPNSNNSPHSSSSYNSCSPCAADSIWKILHMILVVIASATINGVVFGVVNNFGVFYAYLTELSKTDIMALGFNNEDDNNNNDNVLMESSLAHGGNGNGDQTLLISTEANITTKIRQTANHTASDALVQSLIAGVGSFNVGLIFFCSIFASILSDRYGIRAVCFIGGTLATIGMYASSVSLNLIYLYVTYGLVLGIGASLVYGPSLAILGHYFTKRLGLVNGLVTAGSSAFSIVMPILLRWLLDLVGIQVTFKYLSILMATLILCSLSFKERIKRLSKQNGSAKKNLANMFFYDALWKNNLYLYWVISIPMGLFGYFVPFCHLVKHARVINSYYQGEVLVMSIGITSMIGRLITGPLADFSRINRICLQQIAFASIGLLTMFLPFVRDFSLLLVCCGLGLFDGTFISLIGPIAFDLVGPEYANQAIGLLLCFCSLPLTTGPPIAAYAYGIYGDYKLAFCLAGIPPIFAAILMFNIIRMQKMQRRRTSTVKLGIDEPRSVFDEVLIVGHHYHNSSNNNKLMVNGEKLHLLINGSNDNSNHHYRHMGINGTTKMKLPNNPNDLMNGGGNEKTGLLMENGDCDGGGGSDSATSSNNIVILPKDYHHDHDHHRHSSVASNQSKKSSEPE